MHEFTTFRCPACKGVAHPASGCQHSEFVVICGPCTRKFNVWLSSRLQGKPKKRPATPKPVPVRLAHKSNDA
jgi:hypothetical protein